MDLGEALIVAGIGFRKAISAAEIESAIAVALRSALLADAQLSSIATPAAKAAEPAIRAVAAARGLPLICISQRALEAASHRALTRSARALAAMNVHSVAESAALAAAGPQGRLLSPRIAVGSVTCALAEGKFTP